jgi:hypothetical protein
LLINKNRDKILELVENLARERDIPLKIGNLEAALKNDDLRQE